MLMDVLVHPLLQRSQVSGLMLAFPKEACCNCMTSSLSCSKWSVFFSINLCSSLLIMHATSLRRTQSLSCSAHPCRPSTLGWWAWRVSSDSPVPVLSSPTAWQTNQCLCQHISSSKLRASPQFPTWLITKLCWLRLCHVQREIKSQQAWKNRTNDACRWMAHVCPRFDAIILNFLFVRTESCFRRRDAQIPLEYKIDIDSHTCVQPFKSHGKISC